MGTDLRVVNSSWSILRSHRTSDVPLKSYGQQSMGANAKKTTSEITEPISLIVHCQEKFWRRLITRSPYTIAHRTSGAPVHEYRRTGADPRYCRHLLLMPFDVPQFLRVPGERKISRFNATSAARSRRRDRCLLYGRWLTW